MQLLKHLLLVVIAAPLFLTSCKKENKLPSIGIMIVSEWAYKNDQLIAADTANYELNSIIISGIISELYKQQEKGFWNGWIYDWDILRRVDQSLFNDPKAFINLYDYFIVFKEIPSTNPDICSITIELHKGKPYNKNSSGIYFGSGVAAVGEEATHGGTITGHKQACYEAARKAAMTLAQSGKLK